MRDRISSFVQFWFVELVLAGSVWAAPACQMIDGDRIRAGDLVAAVPFFAALNPAVEIGLAPLPGIRRVFHSLDLLQVARRNGIELALLHGSLPPAICIERVGGLRPSGERPNPSLQPAVKRGDKVVVNVTAGGVLLTFESEAESSGRVGDTVMVRNPANGNRFVARVQNPGKVAVDK